MTLEELLQILARTAEEQGVNKPYIVGGVPRNIVLGQLEEIKDVDVTTGGPDIDKLATAFAQKLGKELKDTGKHKSLRYGGVSFDFSTNFVYGNIDEMMSEANVDKPSDLEKETYSRDFTTNTLMLDLNLKNILDLTGRGRQDTVDRVLRCPLDCSASFAHDPKRILRAFHLRARYGYKFSDEVSEAIKRNASMLKTVKEQYASQILNSIVELRPETVDDLVEMGVMQYLPLTKYVTKVLLDKKKILDVL